MQIKSPPSLHYPITVSQLLKQPGDAVGRFAPLFSYTYRSEVTETNKYGDEAVVSKTFPAEFQSETEGKLVRWSIKSGDVIHRAGSLLVEVEEPCKHEVQFGGICAICGKEMDKVDYVTTTQDTNRATINMTHGNTGLMLSESEASRHSESAKKRLLQSRKLSLVVDLDQTIIHAAFDPTIGEWKKDPSNPNYEALQSVRSFKLIDENAITSVQTEYYIQQRIGMNHSTMSQLELEEEITEEIFAKLRPGLAEFLEEISKKYELHIYTMATRAYAREVANIIDPDHKYFGDRIVSRDESGSLAHKDIKRIFPIDDKLVVVMDDRADVWHWIPNLIKVNPYCFFVGIGDINAMYLPKQTDGSVTSPTPTTTIDANKSDTEDSRIGDNQASNGTARANEDATEDPEGMTDIEQRLVAMANLGAEDLKEQSHKQEEMMNEQITERPLQKMQEMLDKQDEEEASNTPPSGNTDDPMEVDKSPTPKQRHSILHDNDEELIHLQATLERVHEVFFDEYDRQLAGARGGRVAALKKGPMMKGLTKKGSVNWGPKAAPPKIRPEDELQLVPDIKDIIPKMRSAVLKGVVICFTGVIPQNTDHQLSDIGMWAQSFGAVINQEELPKWKSITHVVTHKDRRTKKAGRAAKYPHIKFVTVSWLTECFSRWRHVSETPYLINIEPDRHGSQGSLPLDDLDNEGVMSASESTGAEDAIAQLPDEDDFDLEETGEEEDYYDEDSMNELERNPIGEEEWDDMHAEVDAFLLEDAQEEGEEYASDSSIQSSRSEGGRLKRRQAMAARKRQLEQTEATGESGERKRKRDDTESAGESDAEGSVNGEGSELQKRKRRALERTTGLSNVAVADKSSGLPSPDTTGAEEENQEGDDDFTAAFVAGLEEAEENDETEV